MILKGQQYFFFPRPFLFIFFSKRNSQLRSIVQVKVFYSLSVEFYIFLIDIIVFKLINKSIQK